jgi:nucleotide-binding universal stress UspA family protein
MSIFNRILFVANGADAEQHALAQAAALAEASDADVLTIMDVRAPGAPTQASRRGGNEEQGYSISEGPVQPLKGQPPVKIESGRSLRDVVDAAGNFDLVVKAAAAPALRLLNKPAHEDRLLLRECPCPIWIVRQSQRHLHPRVLASIEFFDDAETETALAAEVIAHAAAAAKADHAKVEVVHAWQIRRELELRERMNIEGLLSDVEQAHRRHLDRLLDGCGIRLSGHHVVNGAAGEVIPPLAERRQADLVVVANARRSRLARMLTTSPAEQLLGRLDCSVLLVNQRAGAERPVRPERAAFESLPQRVARSAHG